MKKKGFFLIECSIYIWFCSIFGTLLLSLFLPYIKEFKNQIRLSESYNYMLGASIYIDNYLLKENAYYILGENNELKIYSDNDILEMDILRINNSNKLVVDHYKLRESNDGLDSEYYIKDENYKRVATNTILKDVENYEILLKENLIYIFLKQNNNSERVFCYENMYNK